MIRACSLGTGLQWPSSWRAYVQSSSRRRRRPDRTGMRPLLPFYHKRMDFSLDPFYPAFGVYLFEFHFFFSEIMQATCIHVCTTQIAFMMGTTPIRF